MSCKIVCPTCVCVKSLSSSITTTGKRSFSVFNFTRHYAKHQTPTDVSDENDRRGDDEVQMDQVLSDRGDNCLDPDSQLNANHEYIPLQNENISLMTSLANFNGSEKSCENCNYLQQKVDEITAKLSHTSSNLHLANGETDIRFEKLKNEIKKKGKLFFIIDYSKNSIYA